jgi:non-homologous end joining protein Ku
MPSAIWTGSLSLGLVVVPVRLYPAIHRKAVRFRELTRSGAEFGMCVCPNQKLKSSLVKVLLRNV